MKLCKCLGVFLVMTVMTIKGYSQVSILDYQTIGISPTTCLLYNFPGPTNPTSLGGVDHYGVVGGIDYTGSEMVLNGDNIGGGCGYGIDYLFDPNYQYKIEVTAKSSATSMVLLWAASKFRTAIPASCAPGFPNIILSNPDAYNSVTNMPQTYADYTLIDKYVPTQSGVTYFLMSGYNTVGSIGNVQIQKITITQSCRPPVLNSVTPLGGNQAQLAFTHPNGGIGVGDYSVTMYKYSIVIIAGIPIILVTNVYNFPNVGLNSPVIVTVPQTGYYFASVTSQCTSGVTSSSNSITVTIN